MGGIAWVLHDRQGTPRIGGIDLVARERVDLNGPDAAGKPSPQIDGAHDLGVAADGRVVVTTRVSGSLVEFLPAGDADGGFTVEWLLPDLEGNIDLAAESAAGFTTFVTDGPRIARPPLEVCDGADQDCDGEVDEAVRDAFPSWSDPSTGLRQPAIVWNGNGFAACCSTRENGLALQILGRTGRPPRTPQRALAGLAPNDVALVWTGDGYTAVARLDSQADRTLVSQRFNPEGSMGGATRIVLEVDDSVADERFSPALQWTGAEHVLAYRSRDTELSLLRLDAAGAPTGLPLRVDDSDAASYLPVMARRGDELLVAWMEPADLGVPHLFTARVSLNGFEVEGRSGPLAPVGAHRPGLTATDEGYALVYAKESGGPCAHLRLTAGGAAPDLESTFTDGPCAGVDAVWAGQSVAVAFVQEGVLQFVRLDGDGRPRSPPLVLGRDRFQLPTLAVHGALFGVAAGYDHPSRDEPDLVFAYVGPMGCFDR